MQGGLPLCGCLHLLNFEMCGYITYSKIKIKTLQAWVHLGLVRAAQHSACPQCPRQCIGGTNSGLCCDCCSTIGRGRLGRGPGQEDMISSDFKGLFCFRKGSSFHSTSLPAPHAHCLWDPSTTCCKSIISPPEEPLGLRWGEEGGPGWEGASSSLPKGCHSFPDVISSGMMPFCQLRSESWHLRPSMTRSNGTKRVERECVCAHVCPPVHFCSPLSGMHSLLHSASQQVFPGHLLYASLHARPRG